MNEITTNTNDNTDWLNDETRKPETFITKTATAAREGLEGLFKVLTHQKYIMRDGMDYYDGRLWYSMQAGMTKEKLDKDGKVKEKSRPNIVWLTSGNMVETKLPPGISSGKFALQVPFSTEAIKAYLNGESIRDGAKLINSLTQFFRRYVKFRHDGTYSALAHWAAGTWMYMAFPVYPYIRFISLKSQSGKSTAMEMVAQTSFGHPELWVSPTPASVFRTINQEAKVIAIDEFEKATDEDRSDLIEMFNTGYKRGGMVPRCNKDQGNKVEHFQTYCPKLYAGLNKVPETLASRSIQVLMFRKSKKDKVQRFSPQLDAALVAEMAGFRDALAIWALTNARDCAELVKTRPKDLGVPGWLDDRFADIISPLFAIAAVAGTDRDELVEFCGSQTKVRDGADEDKTSYCIVECLKEAWPAGDDSARFHLSTIVSLLGKKEVYTGTKEVGDILRNMDLEVKQVRAGVENKNLTGVELRKEDLDALVEQFVEL